MLLREKGRFLQVDAWQMGAIFALDAAGSSGCTIPVLHASGPTHQLENCTALQRRAVAQYLLRSI